MKFTQFEIVEIQKIGAREMVPMIFSIDSNDSIDYDYANNRNIQSILRKEENLYKISATNSNGTSYFAENEKFDVFKLYIQNWIKAIKRDNPYEIERKENIVKLSKNFYNTFQEAIIIDKLGYNESAGMIFRKALEFIVKDFFIEIIPSKRKIIEEKTIGQIITHFYDINEKDIKIKDNSNYNEIKSELETIRLLAKIIRNSFKLGNDFSHYERKLLDFNSKDLQDNILKILNFIDNLIEERKLQNTRNEYDEQFDAEELI